MVGFHVRIIVFISDWGVLKQITLSFIACKTKIPGVIYGNIFRVKVRLFYRFMEIIYEKSMKNP